jgi:hypothetical protein
MVTSWPLSSLSLPASPVGAPFTLKLKMSALALGIEFGVIDMVDTIEYIKLFTRKKLEIEKKLYYKKNLNTNAK